jgi:PilZ domain
MAEMDDRRRRTRQKSFLRGCIYFNNRRSAADCLVRDISATGARVIISAAVSVPDFVELYIPQKEQTLRAHVQWRRRDEMGVSFAEEAHDSGSPAAAEQELARRGEKLEAEIAALKKVLKRLKADLPTGGEDAA